MEGGHRGKRTDNREWVYGYLTFINPNHAYICDKGVFFHEKNLKGKPIPYTLGTIYRVIPKTVDRWTGLRDKNKKKIYYNDVLKGENGKYWVVKKGKLAIHLKCVKWRGDECNEEYDIITYSKLLKRGGREFEDYFIVVGNIHDNPEFRR